MDKFAEQPIEVFMADGSPLPPDFAQYLTDVLSVAGIDWAYA